MKILYIFAFDTNLQHFAFSYISIICSLYLHKFSYDSQIHNVLTCVNTLHFSEWNFVSFCFIWQFAWFRSWGVWYIVYPTRFGIYPTRIINFNFQFCLTLTFSINHPTQSHFEKNALLLYFHFFNHSSHLIPPNPTFEIILQFCSTFTFSIIHPTQSHFWNCFAFLNNFPFFQSFIPPKSHPQT